MLSTNKKTKVGAKHWSIFTYRACITFCVLLILLNNKTYKNAIKSVFNLVIELFCQPQTWTALSHKKA